MDSIITDCKFCTICRESFPIDGIYSDNKKHKKFINITTLKLPEEERIIGWDAPGSDINKERKKEMEKLVAKVEKQLT